jgi:hypothetical protein
MSRQFDVHTAFFVAGATGPSFLVNLQADHLSLLRTVVVSPLWPASDRRPPSPVSIAIEFERRQYWLAINELAFVRVSSLGPTMGNIAAARDKIIRGLDLLFTGV